MKLTIFFLLNLIMVLIYWRFPKQLLKNEQLAYWFFAVVTHQLFFIVMVHDLKVLQIHKEIINTILMFLTGIVFIPFLMVLFIEIWFRTHSGRVKFLAFLLGSALLAGNEQVAVWSDGITNDDNWSVWYTFMWPLLLALLLWFAYGYRILLSKEEGWR